MDNRRFTDSEAVLASAITSTTNRVLEIAELLNTISDRWLALEKRVEELEKDLHDRDTAALEASEYE